MANAGPTGKFVITRRMIPRLYYIFVDVISIIDFQEIYVRDRYPLKKENDNTFLQSLQSHYAESYNCTKLPYPRLDSVAAVKIDGKNLV